MLLIQLTPNDSDDNDDSDNDDSDNDDSDNDNTCSITAAYSGAIGAVDTDKLVLYPMK